MRMRFYQFCSFLLLTLAQAAVISSNPGLLHLNTSVAVVGVGNQTLLLPDPPESLGVTYYIKGPTISSTSCLMNAVDALKTLALGDYDAKIFDGTEYRLDSFPQTSIVVSTQRRKRSIQASYIIFAIMMGVREMISTNQFQLAQFELRWNGDLLGWVHVVGNSPALGSTFGGGQISPSVDVAKRRRVLQSTNATTMIDEFNITDIVATDQINDPQEARVSTTFTPAGAALGIFDIFMPVMNAITDMAESPSTYRTDGLVAGFDGARGIVCLLQVVPHRTTPPFMEYRWIIRAIARIPGYMLAHHRFGEVSILMSIDGVPVAFGRVTTVPDCQQSM